MADGDLSLPISREQNSFRRRFTHVVSEPLNSDKQEGRIVAKNLEETIRLAAQARVEISQSKDQGSSKLLKLFSQARHSGLDDIARGLESASSATSSEEALSAIKKGFETQVRTIKDLNIKYDPEQLKKINQLYEQADRLIQEIDVLIQELSQKQAPIFASYMHRQLNLYATQGMFRTTDNEEKKFELLLSSIINNLTLKEGVNEAIVNKLVAFKEYYQDIMNTTDLDIDTREKVNGYLAQRLSEISQGINSLNEIMARNA